MYTINETKRATIIELDSISSVLYTRVMMCVSGTETGWEPVNTVLLNHKVPSSQVNSCFQLNNGQGEVVVSKVQTADSCFGLIGPRQCSAALGGPPTSNS